MNSFFSKLSKLSRRQWIGLISAIILLLFIPIWLVFMAPGFEKLPDDFSYQANLLSIDNFYDNTTQKFQGEHISKTAFSYHVVDAIHHYDTIQNTFSVRTLNDKPIIS